jgi:protein-L-isoaspartate(D-aspartate) O-methyltransferase
MAEKYVDRLLESVLAHLSEYSGVPSLRERLPSVEVGNAFHACPRHKFLPGCEAIGDDLSIAHSAASGRNSRLDLVYTDQSLGYEDLENPDGSTSNSKPSVNYWILYHLQLALGLKVLEIGAGGGWLAALVSHLVGPGGTVVGLEVDPSLAEIGMRNVERVGFENVTILAGDGLEAIPGDDLFDRIVLTTSVPTVPRLLIERLAEGGILIAPVAMRTGTDLLFKFVKSRGRLESQAFFPTVFVPARDRNGTPRVNRETVVDLENLPEWRRIQSREVGRRPMWMQSASERDFVHRAFHFRMFLAISDRDFVDFQLGSSFRSFGLLDRTHSGIVVCRWPLLLAYGDSELFERFVRAYEVWTNLGMPPYEVWRLSIYQSGAVQPEAGDGVVIEKGEEVDLVWDLDRGNMELPA